MRRMPDAQTDPGSAAQPTIITDFAKLNDGTLLELFEDTKMQSKRQSQTVLTWLTEILPGVFRQSARPSRVAHLVRSADGLIGPVRVFA